MLSPFGNDGGRIPLKGDIPHYSLHRLCVRSCATRRVESSPIEMGPVTFFMIKFANVMFSSLPWPRNASYRAPVRCHITQLEMVMFSVFSASETERRTTCTNVQFCHGDELIAAKRAQASS